MKSKFDFLCIAVSLFLLPQARGEDGPSHTSTFPQLWLKSLVSIELTGDGTNGQPIGSGFLVQSPSNHVRLVTAKHVILDEKGKQRDGLAYRINSHVGKSVLGNEGQVFAVIKSGWFFSSNADVGCRMITWQNNADFSAVPLTSFLTNAQLEAGAPIYVMGFPMGLRSREYATPILRHGWVAKSDADGILLDAFIFPGNSGGPIVYGQELQFNSSFFQIPVLQGYYLAGIATENLSYNDIAVSLQTKEPRMSIPQNSGISGIVPAKDILELLNRPDVLKTDEIK